jgi:hypothetical protein
MNTTRYIFREEPITPEMAQVARTEQIKQAETRMNSLLIEAHEEHKHLKELNNSPLPTTIKVQVTLRPGDDGYDEAPVNFAVWLDDENPWRKKLTPTT